jgi:hypothetical protein
MTSRHIGARAAGLAGGADQAGDTGLSAVAITAGIE